MRIHHIKGRHILSIAAILLGGVVGSGLLIYKSQERTTVHGKLDSASGYRCQFTVSPSWQAKLEDSAYPLLDFAFVTRSPQPSIWQWLDSHLLHRAPGAVNASVLSPPEYITFWSSRDVMSVLERDRYLDPTTPYGIERLPDRHLQIDGSPATICSFEATSAGKLVLVRELSIDAPLHPIVISLEGHAERRHSDEFNRELDAILASVHWRKAVAGK